MEQVARIDPDSDETPTLGRERSFLEDLFGNIGRSARRARAAAAAAAAAERQLIAAPA